MSQQYHILNGDCLKEQFPKKIEGEIIVARECLVDGNVKGESLEELFVNRAEFLSQNYGGEIQDYYEKTVPEVYKILNIKEKSEINLWFEDDLFCQVNFWFVLNLLTEKVGECKIFLVRPKSNLQYGFGALNQRDLNTIYENRRQLQNTEKISSLWVSYQNNDFKQLKNTAKALNAEYPFILQAVLAHIDRGPNSISIGRPYQSILKIIDDLKTEEFGPIFKEFSRREAIYGFGDMQFKRIYDEVLRGDKSS